MITLRQQLYESLLDDEEDLAINNPDKLEDLKSELYEDYKINGIVREPAKLIDDHTIEFNGFTGKGLYIGNASWNKHYSSIGEYLPNVDTIKYDGTIYIYPTDTLTGDTVCENIIAQTIYVLTKPSDKIENINFMSDTQIDIYFNPVFGPIVLKNIIFKNGTKSDLFKGIIHFYGDKFPQFNNVITPDGAAISIYNVRLGEDNNHEMDKAINDLLDTTYKTTVFDSRKREEILRKSDLKKIQATISNPVRYNLKTDLFHFKKGAKVSKLIPNLPKGVGSIRIRNNKMDLIFTKMKPDNIPSHYCQYTDDGWRLEFVGG